jgi:hypothetical protein
MPTLGRICQYIENNVKLLFAKSLELDEKKYHEEKVQDVEEEL